MYNKNALHHIQRSIILQLAQHSPLRFSQLQPPRIPNNTFSYHLKKLIENGYIESGDNGYSPTRKALKLLNDYNPHAPRQAAPSMTTVLYITNEKGETLLLNRNKKPFKGWYSYPGGSIHFGETLVSAAVRELEEKTTLIADESEFELKGCLDYQYIEEGTEDIFYHGIAFIYHYRFNGPRDELQDIVTKYGQLSWSKLGRKYLLPEVFTIRDIVEEKISRQASITYVEPPHSPVLSLALS